MDQNFPPNLFTKPSQKQIVKFQINTQGTVTGNNTNKHIPNGQETNKAPSIKLGQPEVWLCFTTNKIYKQGNQNTTCYA